MAKASMGQGLIPPYNFVAKNWKFKKKNLQKTWKKSKDYRPKTYL
jgi:hypothetical protein